MRIEINLTKETADALHKKSKALNHSRKSYIEFLCIKDTTQINKRKGNKKANT